MSTLIAVLLFVLAIALLVAVVEVLAGVAVLIVGVVVAIYLWNRFIRDTSSSSITRT